MRTLLRAVVLAMCCTAAYASDAYVVRFSALGPPGINGNVLWRDDLLLANTNASSAQVRILGISNGALPPGQPTSVTLSPGKVQSLNSLVNWSAVPETAIWVVHLDVPAGVVMESRDEFYFQYHLQNVPPVPLGKVSMPIFRSLAPANTPMMLLGSDLSSNDSRINVGVYNAGAAEATATIEVRRTCDSVVVDSRVVSIAPNTIVQVPGLSRGNSDCSATNTPDWMRYTVVTVNQPSFAYAANVTEQMTEQPGAAGVAPIVMLAVTKPENF